MNSLLKGAILAGGATALYKWLKPVDVVPAVDTGPIRDAGPHELHGITARQWDRVDEQSDQSFPASDAPGNY